MTEEGISLLFVLKVILHRFLIYVSLYLVKGREGRFLEKDLRSQLMFCIITEWGLGTKNKS